MRFQRMIVAMGVLAAAGTSVPALAAMDANDAIAMCSRISKKDARMECYDQVARDVASGQIARSAPTMQGPAPMVQAPMAPQNAAPMAQQAPGAPQQSWTAPPPPNWTAPPAPNNGIATLPPSQFGRSSAPQQLPPAQGFGGEALRQQDRGAQGPDRIQAQVVSASDNGLEQWRITLSDGAVWQMTERTPLFRPPAPQEIVTIKKGALGGFMMDVGKQASVRVMRVR